MRLRTARLHRRRRWRHRRPVFAQRRPLPRMPLPVLLVAVLLTVAALALQGTRGSGGSGKVAAVGPELAAFSVTATEVEIDAAQAAGVPLAGGIAPGAAHAGAPAPAAPPPPESIATTAAPVPVRAGSCSDRAPVDCGCHYRRRHRRRVVDHSCGGHDCSRHRCDATNERCSRR